MASGAPDHNLFIKEIFLDISRLFELSYGNQSNINSNSGFPNMFDLDNATHWQTQRDTASLGNWDIIFDFGEAKTGYYILSEMQVYNDTASGTFDLTLGISNDNSTYTSIGTASAATGSTAVLTVATLRSFRYIRFRLTDNSAASSSARGLRIRWFNVGKLRI